MTHSARPTALEGVEWKSQTQLCPSSLTNCTAFFRFTLCLFLLFQVSRTITASSRNGGHTDGSVHRLALDMSASLDRVCQTGAQVDALDQGAYLPPAAPTWDGLARPLYLPLLSLVAARVLLTVSLTCGLERAGDKGEGVRLQCFCVPLEGVAPELKPQQFTAHQENQTLPLDTWLSWWFTLDSALDSLGATGK